VVEVESGSRPKSWILAENRQKGVIFAVNSCNKVAIKIATICDDFYHKICDFLNIFLFNFAIKVQQSAIISS